MINVRRLSALRSFYLLALLALVISACEIEGGVPEPGAASPTTAVTQTTAAPATANPVATALALRRDTWAIGLVEKPADLYPYPATAASRRALAPISELLFPSPILAFNYGYTTTGVLERIPTLENGDAQLGKADVYLDAASNITTTVTNVITQADQLAVTFHWNKNLRWSDGTPLTAVDSVFAYELAKIAPPGDDARLLVAQTERYEQVDDYTTRAVLKPNIVGRTYFLSYWTPLPRHLLQGVDPATIRQNPFAQSPVGYGPYMIEQVQPGAIHLARNPHYFGGQPNAQRVKLDFVPDVTAAQTGMQNMNIDVLAADRFSDGELTALETQAQARKQQVSYFSTPIWEHIDFNLDTEVLQDIRVRRAIALGTNRQRMVDTLYHGHTPVLESWILPGQPDAAPLDQLTRYGFNPDEARRLLDEAGYSDPDGDGIRGTDVFTLSLQLFTSESPFRQRVAELFREDMRAIGIDIELVPLANAQLFAEDGPLFLRQFDLALYAWIGSPDAGGLQLWSCLSVPSEKNNWVGENFAGWCFRDADRTIREAATTLDPQVRAEMYLKHQQLWTQEIPVLPLFQRLSVVAAMPDIEGLQPDPLAPITWNIVTWSRTAQ